MFFKQQIPKENAQEVTIQESWRLEWTSYKLLYSYNIIPDSEFNAKVFPLEKDADEYKKQLEEAAKFVNTIKYNMEKLCPAAQVASVIGLVLVTCIFIVAFYTDFF